ncbi:MAG: peptide-methionine (S)-S-oxide reductase MsrA [Candidatus Harrisonbacteria bacterium]|nr:peptide-methionine (S)-S-oxide reductase MsrA [Candidatus Harrisonbacteria bacterium]
MNKKEIIVFGGGCFWCTEAIFLELKGVTSVIPGYTGGTTANPTYDEVSTGKTGHVEVIRIEYDPKIISAEKLLEVFFMSHDPTTLNKQGADIGSQYRSIILYTNETQLQTAKSYIKNLDESKKYPKPIVTELKQLENFYPAEEYHQKFYEKNPEMPYSQAIIAPKVEKLRQHFKELLKKKSA